jgi:hypothetical protein
MKNSEAFSVTGWKNISHMAVVTSSCHRFAFKANTWSQSYDFYKYNASVVTGWRVLSL